MPQPTSRRLASRLTGHTDRVEPAAGLAAQRRGFSTTIRRPTLPRAAGRPNLPQPMVILGFPYSGSTLVGQSWSPGPRVPAVPSGYLSEIPGEMTRLLYSPLTYPEALAELWVRGQACRLHSLLKCQPAV